MQTTLNRFKTIGFVAILLAGLQGCSSNIGAKNTQFVEGQSAVENKKMIVNVCRPSAIYKAMLTGGLAINGEPVTEIGSNEKYRIEIPANQSLRLTFYLPKEDLLVEQKSFNAELKSPQRESYLVFSVANTDSATSLGVTAVLGGFVNSKWMAKPVSKDQYESICSGATVKSLMHRSLLN